MSELDIISQKSGPLGESIKNPLNPAFSDFASGGSNKINSTNLNLGLDDDLVAQTIIQNKLDFISGGGGSKLEYPIDVSGNPAYAATVKFQIMEYGMPNESESQKNHAQTPSDNISVETVRPKVEQQDNQLGIDGPAAAAARLQAQAYSNDAEGSTKNPGFQFFDDTAVTQSFVKTKSEDEADAKNIKASSSSKFKIDFFKKLGSPSIVMYFPLSQTFYDNIAYGSADLGGLGAVAEGAASSGANELKTAALDAIKNTTDAVISSLSDITGALSNAAKTDAARLAASKVVGKFPLGVGTAATLINRMVINPNTRTLFNGVNIREFAFQFKLISTSPTEGEIIQKIIKFFRKQAYPEAYNVTFGAETNVALGYNFPDAFKITFHFRGAENKNIPRILPCYLRTVSHTINPTGGGFRNDGKPNEIDLTLTFSEYRALQSQDIEKGY
jgi:hypothetical protein